MAEHPSASAAAAAAGTPSGEGAPATPAAPTSPPSPETAPADARVAALEQRLAQQQANQEAIQNYLGRLVLQLQAVQAPEEPAPADKREQLKAALDQDPEAAIDQIFQQRMGPILREQYAQQAELAKREAERLADAGGWGDEWRENLAAVESFMTNVPLDRHLNPKTWLDAMRIQLMDETKFDAVAMRRAQKKIDAERAAASEGASPGRVGPKGPAPLTEAQKRMAKACGLSEEQYRAELAAIDRDRGAGV